MKTIRGNEQWVFTRGKGEGSDLDMKPAVARWLEFFEIDLRPAKALGESKGLNSDQLKVLVFARLDNNAITHPKLLFAETIT